MFSITVPQTEFQPISPFHWGDMVKIKSEQTTDLVFMPDNTFMEAKTFVFSQGKNEYGHYFQARRAWADMEFVAKYEDYANDEIKSLMEPYRKGVCINIVPWKTGIDFFDDFCRQPAINYILKNQEQQDYPGDWTLIEKFWSSQRHDWRVLIHRKDNWDHWTMFGPFAEEENARNVFNEKRLEALALPPKYFKPGFYLNNGQINYVGLYKGPYLVARHNLLIGQGEKHKYRDGINRDIEEFSITEDYRNFRG